MGELVGISFFVLVGYIIKTVSDNKLRRFIIERGVTADVIKEINVLPVDVHRAPSALKWGMVLTALGLAAVLGRSMEHHQDEYIISYMLLFAGAALVLYYFIGSRLAKKAQVE